MSQLPFSVNTSVDVKIPDETVWKIYFLAFAIILTALIAGKLI